MLPALGMVGGLAGGIMDKAGGGPTAATSGDVKSTNTFGPVSFGSKNTGGGLDWKIIALIGAVVLIGLYLWTRKR